MRVIVDTNIQPGALINPHGLPARLIDEWCAARFTLVTSRDQLLELGEVARRSTLRKYIVPARVGRLLALCSHGRTHIVTLRQLLSVLNPL